MSNRSSAAWYLAVRGTPSLRGATTSFGANSPRFSASSRGGARVAPKAWVAPRSSWAASEMISLSLVYFSMGILLSNLSFFATPMHQRLRFESTVRPRNNCYFLFLSHRGAPGRRGAPDSRGSRDAAPGDGRSAQQGRWPVYLGCLFTLVACLPPSPRCGPCLVLAAHPAQLFSGTLECPKTNCVLPARARDTVTLQPSPAR